MVLVTGSGCQDDEGGQDPPTNGDSTFTPLNTSTSGDTDGSSGGDEAADGQDVCLSARPLSAGRYEGDLANKDSNGGGACGQGGPDVFFKLEVTHRADVFVAATGQGYEPRVGVFGSDCAARFSDAGLLCTQGVPGWILDVAAGTELFVAVGADADSLPASLDGLPFELELDVRSVLSVGEACEPASRGRCEGGSLCLPTPVDELEASGELGGSRCTAIVGDTCASAIEVEVDRGETALVVEADAVHTDAHTHGCAGARTSERVYRLQLPEISDATRLEVHAPEAAALAARGPTCLPAEQRACEHDPRDESLILQPPPSRTLYLFVELPDLADPKASEDAPAVVRLRLSED